jgi:hypothetical protein
VDSCWQRAVTAARRRPAGQGTACTDAHRSMPPQTQRIGRRLAGRVDPPGVGAPASHAWRARQTSPAWRGAGLWMHRWARALAGGGASGLPVSRRRIAAVLRAGHLGDGHRGGLLGRPREGGAAGAHRGLRLRRGGGSGDGEERARGTCRIRVRVGRCQAGPQQVARAACDVDRPRSTQRDPHTPRQQPQKPLHTDTQTHTDSCLPQVGPAEATNTSQQLAASPTTEERSINEPRVYSPR